MIGAGARGLLTGLVVLAMAGAGARAEGGIAGVWEGNYRCGQGETGLTLSIQPGSIQPGTEVQALFHFYAIAANPAVPEGCFEMSGSLDPATREVRLVAGRWRLRPFGYVTVDLSGRVGAAGETMSGAVAGPFCTTFGLHRVARASRPVPAACRGGATVASFGR